MNCIRLIRTDGTSITFPADGGTADGFRVEHLFHDNVHSLCVIPLSPGLNLEAAEYETELKEILLENEDRLLYYDNSAHTNDITEVFRYTEFPERNIAELVIFKNTINLYTQLFGYLTAHRFFSSITLKSNTVVFRTEFEGRILQMNEKYETERFLILDGHNDEILLLSKYAGLVSELNCVHLTKELPVGWCSWSCYYKDVDEEKIMRAADSQELYAGYRDPNLIQIDDGWQTNGSFPGKWKADTEKFPHGINFVADYVKSKGMSFGLWLSPLMIDEKSEYYDELKDMIMPDITLDTHYHPFDLGDPSFLELLRTTFRDMIVNNGATYFKIDFIAAAVRYFNTNGTFVKFKNGFCIECLRTALKTIRSAVGNDVYLLSCGAPLLVSAGIFDGARISCDIIWGKNTSNPSYWQIMKNVTRTVNRRFFYHNRVFLSDADGLVTRDTENGDGFNCTYTEAKLWAITVALSGGAVLTNDELELLSPARRSLYSKLLPPLNIPAHPVEYFDKDAWAFILPAEKNKQLLALYNWNDKMTDGLHFDLERIRMKGALVVDAFSGKTLGFNDSIDTGILNPHDAAIYLLIMPDIKPAFAFSDDNIFCGINLYYSVYSENHLILHRKSSKTRSCSNIYALFPSGYEPEGEIILKNEGCTLTKLN